MARSRENRHKPQTDGSSVPAIRSAVPSAKTLTRSSTQGGNGVSKAAKRNQMFFVHEDDDDDDSSDDYRMAIKAEDQINAQGAVPEAAGPQAAAPQVMSDGEEDEEEEFNDVDEEEDCDFAECDKLPSPDIVARNLSTITDLLNGPYLDLNPPYQRDVVWSRERMSALILSLYENFYIPPVIFNIKRMDAGSDTSRFKRVCVDGKQRLSSVRAFIEGDIPVMDANGVKWYFVLKEGAKRGRNSRVLDESHRQDFRTMSLLCYEFDDLTRTQEEDLFARVQKGMPLTIAEKFKATRGEWQTLADVFETDFNAVMKLSKDRRASGWRNILACFSQIMEVDHYNTDAPVLRTSHQHIEKMLKSPKLCDAAMKAQLRRVFTTFAELLSEKPATFSNNNYANVKTFSPLEMVLVTVLLSLYPDRPHRLLDGDIIFLRKELRRVNKDLKLNSIVWKDAWILIRDLETSRGAVDGSTAIARSRAGVDNDSSSSDGSDSEEEILLPQAAIRRARAEVATESAIVYEQPKETPKAKDKRKSTVTSSKARGRPSNVAQALKASSDSVNPRKSVSKSMTRDRANLAVDSSESGILPIRGTPTPAPRSHPPIMANTVRVVDRRQSAGFLAINNMVDASAGLSTTAQGVASAPGSNIRKNPSSSSAQANSNPATPVRPPILKRAGAPIANMGGNTPAMQAGSSMGPPSSSAPGISRKRRERMDFDGLSRRSSSGMGDGGKRIKTSPPDDD